MKIAPTATTDDTPLLRPITLRLPAPLDDKTLLWLSAHNEALGFEQTAEGALILSPTASPGNEGEISLLTQLANWNERTKFGKVRGISGGVLLPKGGQYGPDAFVVPQSTWNEIPMEGRKKGFVPVLPVAIFELLSPANVTATGFTDEFQEKLEAYKRSAVSLVVLLDPRSELSTIRRPEQSDQILANTTLAFPELPDLELNVAAIYASCNNP